MKPHSPQPPGFTSPKLLWLKNNHADIYHAASHFCLPHDYVNLYLTGHLATDQSDASGTGYFDTTTHAYSP